MSKNIHDAHFRTYLHLESLRAAMLKTKLYNIKMFSKEV